MNKREYLDRLEDLLACLSKEQRAESLAFYEEMIDDRIEEGMTEEEAVAALDAPGVAAEAILDELPAVPRAVAKTRRKSRVLLWAAVIVGSPIWLSLLVAFVIVAVTVYACIWILAACIWVVAAALVVAFPFSLLLAFWGVCAGNVPYALAQAGMGLVGLAFGALCFKGAWVASKQLVRLSRLWLAKVASPFVKRRKNRHDDDSGDGDVGGFSEEDAMTHAASRVAQDTFGNGNGGAVSAHSLAL